MVMSFLLVDGGRFSAFELLYHKFPAFPAPAGRNLALAAVKGHEAVSDGGTRYA